MLRPFLPYAAIVCVAMVVSGCSFPMTEPTGTVWDKLGIPQSLDTWNADLINHHGNFPKWEKKPPLKRIADPANLKSPNAAIKAAAEIKKEQDLAPQKIKALKYLATIGCGCYDKEGKVEAGLLAGLNDCTESVRKTAVETAKKLAGKCGACSDGCGNNCCTAKIKAKLHDMAFGQTNGCWNEPSSKIRSEAEKALNACPPSRIESDERETVPKPAQPSRETVPGLGEPLPEPLPMETTASADTNTEANLDSPVAVAVNRNPPAPVEIATVSATVPTSIPPIVVGDGEELNPLLAIAADLTVFEAKVQFIQESQDLAVLEVAAGLNPIVGQQFAVEIHGRGGFHTVEGNIEVKRIDGALVYVAPIDGLALRVLQPGFSVSILR
ncbi:hypothetical protein GC197_15645 [bacterium]|nr:hypothetical protein [bacterium]